MKRTKNIIIAVLLTVVACFSLRAEDIKREKMKMKEGVCMVDGKMIHMDAAGKCTLMDKPMTMPDGAQVTKNGEVTMKDGKKVMMKEGEMRAMDGEAMMLDDTARKSLMKTLKQK